MTETHEPPSGSEVETLTIGPPGPRRNWSSLRGPGLRIGLGILVAAVLGLLGFSIYGLVVGGTATAQGAADAVVADLNSRDLRGLYHLLDPHEREAYARAAAGLTQNARQLGLGGSGTPSGQSNPNGQVSLDGIDLQLTGVQPTVQKLTPDVALLRYGSGEVTVSVRPAETTGLVRVGLDAARILEPLTRTKPLAELVEPTYGGAGDAPGVGLIAVRSGLRWYVSPAASAAWISRVSTGEIRAEDVTLTLSQEPGAASAREAAVASVTEGLKSGSTGQFSGFAGTLVRSEQVTAEILAAEGADEGAEVSEDDSLRIDAVQFTEGPRQGARQLVNLEKLDAQVADEPLQADSTCITSRSITACATDPSYNVAGPNGARFFAADGKLGVTALDGRGGWKVSLADTLADGVVGWSGGLTREQAVAAFGLAHLEPSGGAVPVGRSRVTYNSAGYAVRTLTVTQPGRYVIAGPGEAYFRVEIYPAAGGSEIYATYDGEIEPTYNGESYRLAAGAYVVVLWSDGGPATGGPDRTEPVTIKRTPD